MKKNNAIKINNYLKFILSQLKRVVFQKYVEMILLEWEDKQILLNSNNLQNKEKFKIIVNFMLFLNNVIKNNRYNNNEVYDLLINDINLIFFQLACLYFMDQLNFDNFLENDVNMMKSAACSSNIIRFLNSIPLQKLIKLYNLKFSNAFFVEIGFLKYAHKYFEKRISLEDIKNQINN